MKIEHIAIWVSDLEKMSEFYVRYFDGRKGGKYVNSKKGFSSYFISFASGCRLELMHNDVISATKTDPYRQATGITHFAFEMGSEHAVDSKTSQLREEGYELVDGPRVTGDGYYESVFLDPEGNRIELACIAGS